jgi:hypothetical protein
MHARPQCVGCMGSREERPASYAFVTYFGKSAVGEIKKELFEGRVKMLPGVTVYCRKCRSMKAVSTHSDLQEDLVSFERRRREWREMHSVMSDIHMH